MGEIPLNIDDLNLSSNDLRLSKNFGMPPPNKPELTEMEGTTRMETIATTSDIFRIEINGVSFIQKVIRRKSRFLNNAPEYDGTTTSKEKYYQYLEDKVNFSKNYQEVIKLLFGDFVVSSQFSICELSNGQPAIVETQPEIENGLRVVLVGGPAKDIVAYDYNGRGNKPYDHLESNDPRYAIILPQLRKIHELCDQIRSNENSVAQISPLVQQFIENHPGYLETQIDVHRLGNVLMDQSGNAHIVDW